MMKRIKAAVERALHFLKGERGQAVAHNAHEKEVISRKVREARARIALLGDEVEIRLQRISKERHVR